MVILQAMACSLLKYTTKNAGFLEIIDDGVDGYIIPIKEIKKN